MKEEIRRIHQGSGSTVCREASTAVGKGASGTVVRPPAGIAAHLNDFFMPRKMEFKGLVTDFTKDVVWKDSQTMMSRISSVTCRRYCRMSFTSILTGTRPRQKKGIGLPRRSSTCVFKIETNMATMIEMLVIDKHDLKKAS